MLSTLAALALAIGSAADPEAWRILSEDAAKSTAVRPGDPGPQPGASGTAYVLITFAQPQPRRGRTSYRQVWTELHLQCPTAEDRGHYGEVATYVAEAHQPLPADDLAPPVALRDFDEGRMGPVALAICRDEQADGALIEGDWATTLATLLARHDR